MQDEVSLMCVALLVQPLPVPNVSRLVYSRHVQSLRTLLNWLGVLGTDNAKDARSVWLWDTDEWEPAWMSEDRLRR